MAETPKGLVLDCYGTLLTIGRPRGVTRRYATLSRNHDGPSPLTSRIGLAEALRMRGVEDDVAGSINEDAIAEAKSVRPIPGAVEAVERAMYMGVRIVIASNLSIE